MKNRSLRRMTLLAASTVCLLAAQSVAARNPITGPEPHRLQNISARARVMIGDRAMIGGFIIRGTRPKSVLIRAIGPSLQGGSLPLAGRLGNPTLELYAGGNRSPIASNDNWRESQEAAITATGIAPPNDLESALLMTLAPGSYTAVVRGRDSGAGIALVEIYDLGGRADQKLENMSARAFVQTDDDVLIGGLIVGGGNEEDATVRVVLRAIGPSLSSRGVSDALADPTLELFDREGNRIGFNDNAGDDNLLELQETGLAPSHAAESAIVTSLAAGNYTAIVRGAGRTSGTALVEVFDIPSSSVGR